MTLDEKGEGRGIEIQKQAPKERRESILELARVFSNHFSKLKE